MKCPKCEQSISHVINDKHFSGNTRKKILERPYKNSNGSINWKNLFYMPPESIALILGILLLLLGFKQINSQCYDILEEPCEVIDKYDCTGEYKDMPEYELGYDLSELSIEEPMPLPDPSS